MHLPAWPVLAAIPLLLLPPIALARPSAIDAPAPPPPPSSVASAFSSLSTWLAPHPRLAPRDVILSPLLLVTTLDGGVHALDRVTGVKRWSALGGGAAPVVSSEVNSNGSDRDDERFVVDPLKGELWIGTRERAAPGETEWKMRKMGLTMPDLVQASFLSSPVLFAQPRIFLGEMKTSLIGIDLDTGAVVGDFGNPPGATVSVGTPLASCGPLPHARGRDLRESDMLELLDEMEADHESASFGKDGCGNLLYLRRTDYTLTISSLDPRSPSHTLRYSAFGPSTPSRLSSIWGEGRTADGRYATLAAPAGGPWRLIGIHDMPAGGMGATWGADLGDVPVAVFEVLNLANSPSSPPFILPQAIPSLSRMLPPQSPSAPTAVRNLLYIGQPERFPNSIYALADENYPLIRLAEALPSSRKGAVILGYHSLDPDFEDEDGIRTLGMGLDRPRIDGEPSLPESSQQRPPVNNEAKQKVPAQTIDVPPSSSRRWLRIFFLVYLPLLAIGLASVWKFLAPRLPTKGVYPFPPSSTAFEPQPITRSSPLEVSQPSPSMEKELPPLPAGTSAEVDEEEGEIGTAKKKKRRAKNSRSKKKGAKAGDEGNEDSETGAKEVVAASPTAVDDLAPGEARRLDGPSPPGDAVTTRAGESVRKEDGLRAEAPKNELIVSDKLLGVGSHGTMVFEGTFQSRPVAVKRLLSHFTTLASHEVSLLQSSDSHPNVVRYFYEERKDPWLFIALELCPASLADLVERPKEQPELAALFDHQAAMKGIVRGVGHLHEMKICHRDIKPQNILVSRSKNKLRMLISDFGLARRVAVDQSSFGATLGTSSATTMMPSGTPGWRAPEVLMQKGSDSEDNGSAESPDDGWEVVGGLKLKRPAKKLGSLRLTSAVDVFALGCVLFYTLTGGAHPFGDRYERDRNICKDRYSLELLSAQGHEAALAKDLIASMINVDSRFRPTTAEILLHPWFWSAGRRLAFLQEASDRFENLVRDPPDPVLLLLEQGATKVIGPSRDWIKAMDDDFVDSLSKYRKYDVSSIRDLLRALRNKRHHYMELSPELLAQMSPLPEGFLAYFTSRFPLLFIHVYNVILASYPDKDVFQTYFSDDTGDIH